MNTSAQATQANESAHHHESDRQGGDPADVPSQAAEVVVREAGDQPQPGMDGQGGGTGEQQELHPHEHPDRVGRAEKPLEAWQIDPAHPQAGEHLDRQSRESQRPPAAETQTRQQPGSCFHDGSNPPGLTMKVIVDLCVVPIGVGVHLAPFIAACEKVLSEAGLKIQLHPNGTAIEGEWEPVFAAIEACHQAVHAMGCPQVYTTVKINTRTDRDQTLEDKVASVQALL